MNNQIDFEKELNGAINEHLELIKSGQVNSDCTLYDLIMGGKFIDCSEEEKVLVKRILSLKKQRLVSNDELKKVINEIGFPVYIPRVVRLYIVREQLREQYVKRCNHE